MSKGTKMLALVAVLGLALAMRHNGGANPLQVKQPARGRLPAPKQTPAQLAAQKAAAAKAKHRAM